MYVTNRPSTCKKTTGKAPRNLITPVKGYVIESSKCQRRALSTEANKHDQVKSANWQNLQYTSNVEGSGNKVKNESSGPYTTSFNVSHESLTSKNSNTTEMQDVNDLETCT